MKLFLDRKYKKSTYTIGKLYIDGVYFCDTLEDKDRGLKQSDSLAKLREKKVPNETAIPTGTYKVSLATQSPKYANRAQYAFCKGYLPRLLSVPCYDGILIHIGNYADYETFFKKVPIDKKKALLSVQECIEVV